MSPTSLIGVFLAFANQLKFKYLFFLTTALFVIDLIVPDMMPLIDEIILGLLAIILANWKKEKAPEQQGTLIEGEAVDEDDK